MLRQVGEIVTVLWDYEKTELLVEIHCNQPGLDRYCIYEGIVLEGSIAGCYIEFDEEHIFYCTTSY